MAQEQRHGEINSWQLCLSTASVISIDLHNPYANASDPKYDMWNLSGRVDHSLLQLKFMRHLNLSYNNFNDLHIPHFIGFLKRLKYLNLSNVGFAGTRKMRKIELFLPLVVRQ
ncbi:hypothetical protein ZIOFF_066030 [Zingiber officinale]|uniref:Uncharacterized protein n=1 Tax=Zingiber officinale TaxID=94328 RepID=A0A8J5EY10_ZINOF|nr:hypothetical protein ZIOFF_066030 [Zingiber officinale]